MRLVSYWAERSLIYRASKQSWLLGSVWNNLQINKSLDGNKRLLLPLPFSWRYGPHTTEQQCLLLSLEMAPPRNLAQSSSLCTRVSLSLISDERYFRYVIQFSFIPPLSSTCSPFVPFERLAVLFFVRRTVQLPFYQKFFGITSEKAYLIDAGLLARQKFACPKALVGNIY